MHDITTNLKIGAFEFEGAYVDSINALSEGVRHYAVVGPYFELGTFVELFLAKNKLIPKVIYTHASSIAENGVNILAELLKKHKEMRLHFYLETSEFSKVKINRPKTPQKTAQKEIKTPIIPYIFRVLDNFGDRFQMYAAPAHYKIFLIETICGKKIVVKGSVGHKTSQSVEDCEFEVNENLFDGIKKVFESFNKTAIINHSVPKSEKFVSDFDKEREMLKNGVYPKICVPFIFKGRYKNPATLSKPIPPNFANYKNAIKLSKEIGWIDKNERFTTIINGNFEFSGLIKSFIFDRFPDLKVKSFYSNVFSISFSGMLDFQDLVLSERVPFLNLLISVYYHKNHANRGEGFDAIAQLCVNTDSKMCVVGFHNKVTLIEAESGEKYVFHGSANLASHSIFEQFTVEENEKLFDFYKQIFETSQSEWAEKSIESGALATPAEIVSAYENLKVLSSREKAVRDKAREAVKGIKIAELRRKSLWDIVLSAKV